LNEGYKNARSSETLLVTAPTTSKQTNHSNQSLANEYCTATPTSELRLTDQEHFAQLAVDLVEEILITGIDSSAMLRLDAFAVVGENMPFARGAITFIAAELRQTISESDQQRARIQEELSVLGQTLDTIRLSSAMNSIGIDQQTGSIELSPEHKAQMVASSLVVSLLGDADAYRNLNVFCSSSRAFSHIKDAINGALLRNGSFDNPLEPHHVMSIHLSLEHIYTECSDRLELNQGLSKQAPFDFHDTIQQMFTERFGAH
jgi:hypothetical protein